MDNYFVSKKYRLSLVISTSLLSACAINPTVIDHSSVLLEANNDLKVLSENHEAINSPLNLSMVIARAVKYNREQRLKVMEAALASNQLDLARFNMLPELAVSAGYSERNQYAASASTTFENGQPRPLDNDPSYSVSQGKRKETSDIAFTWNVLDFGLSYVRAEQQADRYLIAKERERKAVHNIIQQARYAYWRAISADRLSSRIEQLINQTNEALSDSQHIEKMRLKSPIEALSYQRELLDALRYLLPLQKELISARSELASLMGLRPGQKFTLEIPKMKMPVLKMDLSTMEKTALVKRPEVMESRYQNRISRDEVKAALLEMLPGLSLTAGLHYDSNQYLLNSEWTDYGAVVNWNLFKAFKGPKSKKAAKIQQDLANEQRLATSMAILTQVHIANIRFNQAKKEYLTAEKYLDVSNRIREQTRISRQVEKIGSMNVIREELGSLVAEVRRDTAYAELQNSYGTVFSSLGLDPMPKETYDNSLSTLAGGIQQTLETWQKGGVGLVIKPIDEQDFSFQGAGPQEFTLAEDTFYLNGSIRYSAELANGNALPDWLMFDPASRTFSGNPPATSVESLQIRVTATNNSISATDQFSLPMIDTNDVPEIVHSIPDQEFALDDTGYFKAFIDKDVFKDPDGDPLEYRLEISSFLGSRSLPQWLSFNAEDMTISGNPPVNIQSVNLLMVARDSYGALSKQEFTISFKKTLEQSGEKADDGEEIAASEV